MAPDTVSAPESHEACGARVAHNECHHTPRSAGQAVTKGGGGLAKRLWLETLWHAYARCSSPVTLRPPPELLRQRTQQRGGSFGLHAGSPARCRANARAVIMRLAGRSARRNRTVWSTSHLLALVRNKLTELSNPCCSSAVQAPCLREVKLAEP